MNEKDIDIARSALKGHVRCARCRGGELILSEERGIRPMIDWLEADPEILRGASVADKVVGRAAAMLMVYGGVTEVYTNLISIRALELLREYGIPCTYVNTCDAVSNRRGDGICPMERTVAPVKDPAEAYEKLKEKLKEMGI